MKIEYFNLFNHFILVTEDRNPFFHENIRERVEKYITGIVNNLDSKLYSIYANPEHIHFLVSRSPKISEEAFVNIVAESTLKFLIENNLTAKNFKWQDNASVFSVSKSDVDKVCKYILNQPDHHKKMTFDQEYDAFINHYQQTLKWRIR